MLRRELEQKTKGYERVNHLGRQHTPGGWRMFVKGHLQEYRISSAPSWQASAGFP